jgi:hypothetical protein
MEKVYKFWNHVKYVRSDFLSLDFLHFLEGTNFWICSISTNVCISFHSPCEKLETQAWGMYAVSIATLFWPPCLNSSFHTKSTFEKCYFAGFWISMDWNNGVNLQGYKVVLNCQRNNLVIGFFNLWKPLEYLHTFTNCNNINQQNPWTLQANLTITLVEKCQFATTICD